MTDWKKLVMDYYDEIVANPNLSKVRIEAAANAMVTAAHIDRWAGTGYCGCGLCIDKDREAGFANTKTH